MDSILIRVKKIFTRDGENFVTNLGAVAWTKSCTFKEPIIPFGAIHPSPKDQSRIHQCGKKVLPGIFLGFELIARKIWKGYILIAVLARIREMDVQVRVLMRALFSESFRHWICEPREDTFADCLTQRNGCALRAGGVGVGWARYVSHPRQADLEDLEKLDASYIFPRSIKAKEVLICQEKWWIHMPNRRWYSKIVRNCGDFMLITT